MLFLPIFPGTVPGKENQTGSTQVQCLNDYQRSQLEIQEITTDITANQSGDHNFLRPRNTASHIEERLVIDEIANEL